MEREIEAGTLQAILPKPISRWEIIAGKYLGFLAMIAVYVGLMFGGVVLISGQEYGPGGPTFLFRGLNDIKPEMIAEATARAREAAVEFARDNLAKGMELIEATMAAVRDRLRPILMTSLAFGLGVMPLAVATGAGAGAQRAIGTGVLGGMLVGTFFGLFFVPLFFVIIQSLFGRRRRDPARN